MGIVSPRQVIVSPSQVIESPFRGGSGFRELTGVGQAGKKLESVVLIGVVEQLVFTLVAVPRAKGQDILQLN